jgi:hypothetical protein
MPTEYRDTTKNGSVVKCVKTILGTLMVSLILTVMENHCAHHVRIPIGMGVEDFDYETVA